MKNIIVFILLSFTAIAVGQIHPNISIVAKYDFEVVDGILNRINCRTIYDKSKTQNTINIQKIFKTDKFIKIYNGDNSISFYYEIVDDPSIRENTECLVSAKYVGNSEDLLKLFEINPNQEKIDYLIMIYYDKDGMSLMLLNDFEITNGGIVIDFYFS